ncbi:ATP-binding protein [Nocardia amamiensis]|uniref:ATP-binding protein n=1 Tax=Nocardia TaxID=1817 RepID=UPI0033EBB8B9
MTPTALAPSSPLREVGAPITLTDVTAEIITVNHPGVVSQPLQAVAGPSPQRSVDSGLSVPRQLPVYTPHFVGRSEELRRLTALLDTAADGVPVVISAINGTAGIGKTALAVHWAHQVADRFRDGQLYVNLRGFDPTGIPMAPAEAIRGFLDAFGVAPEQMPVGTDAQTALYRRLVSGRKMLLVLDNARDSDQVRPLLPDTASCRVVITSRNQLADLITHHGARPITLDVLHTDDATALLARRVGHDRVIAELDVHTDLIEQCARLPLALSIVAARAALNPRVPLWILMGELRDEQTRLDALDAGHPTTNVRAVFSWSYRQLSRPAARMFRLLGLHPGPDISVPAAASLAGVGPRQVRQLLTELARTHLVAQNDEGRFGFHDLLRAYATELAHTHDNAAERRTAQQRVLDHYLHTAYTAAVLMYPRVQPSTPPPALDGVAAEQVADSTAALAWFQAEHAVLLAVLRLAVTTGLDSHGSRLPHMLVEFFQRKVHWHDWATTQNIALTTAQRSSDTAGQAQAHLGLGRVRSFLGNDVEAENHLRQALALFRSAGDQTGEAHTYREYSVLYEFQNCHVDALRSSKQALRLYRASGDRPGQAMALNNIGWFHSLLGNYQQAVSYGRRALALNQELGSRRSESHTLDSLGYAFHHLGDHARAIAHYQRSLAVGRQLGDRPHDAAVLAHLGDAYHAAGDPQTARDAWQQALDILDSLGVARRASLGSPDAEEIRAKLAELDP